MKESLAAESGDAPSSEPKIELLVLPGSQFVMKAMAALDHLGLEYSIRRVNGQKLKKELPPPHTVPVMHYDGQVVPDSHDILALLNEKHGRALGRDLFPADPPSAAAFETVEALETWSGDVLYVWSLYYSWVDDEAWKRSLRPVIAKLVPGFLQKCCPCMFSPENAVRPIREKQRKRCNEVLGEAVATPEAAQQGIVQALHKLEASLLDDAQQYLQGTEHPTAGDFAVYGNMLRLVDTSFDANIGGGFPDLFGVAKTHRLEAWFGRMKAAYPLQFYGRGKKSEEQ